MINEKTGNKGFTLIELLVVIAIIGILSSVVLASLNTARNKGKAASVQASISQMRAQAELGVNSTTGAYLDGLCTSTATGGLQTLRNGVTANGGTAESCAQNTAAGTAPTAWGYAATLPGGGHYCVDSTGYAGASSVVPGTEITATTDVVCDNT
jgi:type IV pilus assembly protein PilA